MSKLGLHSNIDRSIAGCASVVLVLLAIIPIPIFRSAREEAKEVSCVSNLKQLGTAMMQYQSDNDNRLPGAGNWSSGFAEYLRGSKADKQATFHCPSANKTPYGYAFNAQLNRLHAPLGSLTNDAQLVTLFESDSARSNAQGSIKDVAWHRHPHGAAFLLEDGHARFVFGTVNSPSVGETPFDWSPRTAR